MEQIPRLNGWFLWDYFMSNAATIKKIPAG
jgi:hypothetical protein